MRQGFSLLEVLVAMAIFLFAFAAISQLVTLSADRALEVKLKSQATQLCQAKLAEVMAGAVPLSSQSEATLDEDPSWLWSLDAEQGSVQGLWNVTVKFSRKRANGSTLETSLSQMVLDPSLRGSTLDAVAASNAAAAAASSSSSSSGAGSTTTPAGQSQPTAAAGGAAPKSAGSGGSTPKAMSSGTTGGARTTGVSTTPSGVSTKTTVGTSAPASKASSSKGTTSKGGN
jgi:type II secretion system protein I